MAYRSRCCCEFSVTHLYLFEQENTFQTRIKTLKRSAKASAFLLFWVISWTYTIFPSVYFPNTLWIYINAIGINPLQLIVRLHSSKHWPGLFVAKSAPAISSSLFVFCYVTRFLFFPVFILIVSDFLSLIDSWRWLLNSDQISVCSIGHSRRKSIDANNHVVEIRTNMPTSCIHTPAQRQRVHLNANQIASEAFLILHHH